MNTKLRKATLLLVFVAVFIALIGNVAYLAITGKHLISGQDIRKSPYATGRGMEIRTLYASRGSIYSSDNELLATNVITYKLIVYLSPKRTSYALDDDGNQIEIKQHVTDPKKYAQALAPIIGMDQTLLQELLDINTYDEIPYQIELGNYGSNLTYAQKISIENLKLPGLELQEVVSRNNKFGSLAAHVLGFTEKAKDEEGKVDQAKIVGLAGIELAYDKELSGVDGSEKYYYDSTGYTLPDGITNKVPAVDGNDVYLTINTSVQREAEVYMDALINDPNVYYLWAMIMEAHTGRLLCMVSYPNYDLQKLENITLNFNTDYAYECGSVAKPFVYATAMDTGVYPADQTYKSGNYMIGTTKINDWWVDGWGNIGYDEGLVRSSNVAILNLLDRFIREEDMRNTYEKLGYWQEFELDGVYVTPGINNTENSWVDYCMAGFGQSSTWTAYHLLRAYSTLVNDGCIVEPYLVDYVLNPNTNEVVYKATTKKSEQIFTAKTCQRLREILVDVVNDPEIGTAVQYAMPDIVLAGKSGTGEIYEQDVGYKSGKYNYTFGGFAPADNPEIVMVVGIQGTENIHHGLFAQMVQSLTRTSLNAIHGYGGVIEGGNELEYNMPNFTNHTLEYTNNILSYSGINPIIIGNGTSVIDQFPAKNTTITTTSRVFIKTDGKSITLPDFTGWTRKEVSVYASLANLKINYDGEGVCKAQSIPPGFTVDSNTQILLKLGN